MSSASKRANGRVSGPALTSRFLFVPDHSAPGKYDAEENDARAVQTSMRSEERRERDSRGKSQPGGLDKNEAQE